MSVEPPLDGGRPVDDGDALLVVRMPLQMGFETNQGRIRRATAR